MSGPPREEGLEAWVDAFLTGPGNNEVLASGLRKAERHWLGPLELPIAWLDRCCGPEPGMEFHEDPETWGRKLAGWRSTLRAGGEVAPLIAEYRQGRLSVRDGNHRLGALEAEGRGSAQTVVWHNNRADLERHRRELAFYGML